MKAIALKALFLLVGSLAVIHTTQSSSKSSITPTALISSRLSIHHQLKSLPGQPLTVMWKRLGMATSPVLPLISGASSERLKSHVITAMESSSSLIPLSTHSASEQWADTPAAGCIRLHESTNGANPAALNNLYQFEGDTWTNELGMPGSPGDYPRKTQDAEAYKLYLARGYEPWVADNYYCARFE